MQYKKSQVEVRNNAGGGEVIYKIAVFTLIGSILATYFIS